MKDLMDRGRARITEDEDRRVWEALERRLTRGALMTRLLPWCAGFALIALMAILLFHPFETSKAPEVRVEGIVTSGPDSSAADSDGFAMDPEPVHETPAVEESPTREPRLDESAESIPAPKPMAARDSVSTPPAPEPATNVAQSMPPLPGTGTISVTVTERDGTPMAFVTVLILGTSLGGMTDSTGTVAVKNVPAGDTRIKMLKMGFGEIEDTLRLEPGGTAAGRYKLVERMVASLKEISVVGERKRLQKDSSTTKQKPAAGAGELHFRGGRGPSGVQDASTGGSVPVNGEAFDAMFFKNYGVNPFIDPREDRFATFAMDVDKASYALTRSYLERGALPPAEAVRVEEFVNAFRHDYAPPKAAGRGDRESGSEAGPAFAIHLDAAPSPFGKDLTLLRVGLKGREIALEDRKPATLTFVIDVSGSMSTENRLGLVKESLFRLLDVMADRDEIGIVVYGTEARRIMPHTRLRYRTDIENAIRSLHSEGSTNAEAGLLEGYRLANQGFDTKRINRILLCSDGVANVGRTGGESILDRIGAEARKGIELSTIGFGMGNYNDVLMEQLADKGDGNYHYVDSIEEAERVLVENLTGLLQTIARQAKIQVEFNPEVVRRYRLIGYENRDVADRDFRNDRIDAGEVGSGHEVTALFELKLEGGSSGDSLASVRIRYEDPETARVIEDGRGLLISDVRGEFNRMASTFRMDAAVAEFAEILRGSYWAREGSLEPVQEVLDRLGRTPDSSALQEIRDLVRRAIALKGNPRNGREDGE